MKHANIKQSSQLARLTVFLSAVGCLMYVMVGFVVLPHTF